MPVVKQAAQLKSESGALMGEGRAYVHVRGSLADAQPAVGTLSLDWWDDEQGTPSVMALEDGLSLPIEISSDRLSACIVGRILRYKTNWPGEAATSSPS